MIFKRRRIRKLRDARERAQEVYDSAAQRRDTRAMHEARQKLLKATHALMAAEVRA
jgi:triphosphoribosyl-dephospho-CoA synthetase